MIRDVYKATSSFDGRIFSAVVEKDYLIWADTRDKWGEHSVEVKGNRQYDWRAFHNHYERLRNLTDQGKIMRDGKPFAGSLKNEMRLFFHIAPSQMALLKLSIQLRPSYDFKIMELLFEAIGLLDPFPRH